MRILFVSTIYPTGNAPTRGSYNGALCRALAESHDVHVIAPQSWAARLRDVSRAIRSKPDDGSIAAGIDVELPIWWHTPRCLHSQYGSMMWSSLRTMIAKTVSRFRPDAVLSYWLHPDGEVALNTARLANVPCGVIVGGSDVLLLPKDPSRGDKVRHVLHQSNAILTVSDGLRMAAIAQQTPADRVHTIYQGIDPRQFGTNQQLSEAERKQLRGQLNLPADSPVYLWVGRMAPVKGLRSLIDAFTDVVERSPHALLCLAGWGEQQGDIERWAHTAGIQNSVRMLGAIPPSELADWYRAANATVLSSVSEGLPNVLRESLACKTPFVSTDVGSICEIDNGDASILVKPGDTLALADGMIEVLKPEYRQAAAAHEPRTWSDMAKDVTELFESLIATRSERPAAVPRTGADSLAVPT